MGTVLNITKKIKTKKISMDCSDRLFWLGRYTERLFTTLKALEKLYDSTMGGKDDLYEKYLECFGIEETYDDINSFMESFLFGKNNFNSVQYSLEKAYDNGIVLREEISTEALAYLQLAKDTLEKAHSSKRSFLLALLPLEDLLFSFWGCINDYIYNDEILNIIKCGKSVERLDLFFRMRYPFKLINLEFERLCAALAKIPKNTPYRYNTAQLSRLVEIAETGEDYGEYVEQALIALSYLFEGQQSKIKGAV